MGDRVRIGVIGDYDPESPGHLATDGSLAHAAETLSVEVDADWLPTVYLETDAGNVASFDGLWCAPGSPYRSLAGAVAAIRIAREDGIPFIGTCGGFQHVVIEYARNVLGYGDAQHAEYDPHASSLFITELECSLAGQTMRVEVRPDSLASRLYGVAAAEERYACNFGLNAESQALIERGGIRFSGMDQDGEARILELPGHPFYLATLFMPQLSSSPERPHPLILGYLREVAQLTGYP